ncbi:hypothetical protein JNK13_12050 [bacterium]|nr:hypothetical protein [bacterium]
MRRYRVDQSGVILILTALLAFAMLTLVALVIDIGILSSSSSQQQRQAEYIGLAALYEYSRTAADENGSLLPKVNRAITRANYIAGRNSIVGLPGVENANLCGQISEEGTCAKEPANTNGTIVFGRWYPSRPSTCSEKKGKACPCGVAATPCFLEIPANDLKTKSANAVKINFQTANQNPIRTYFARVIGSNEHLLSSSAIVTMVARHMMFLVDLSSSVDNETHAPAATPPPDPNYAKSESAFAIDPSGGLAACASANSNPCIDANLGDPECLMLGPNGSANPNNLQNKTYYGMSRRRASCADAYCNETWRHFRDDYRCQIVDGKLYLFDEYRHAGTHLGPSPLTPILNGIQQALDEFESRGVPSDRVGAIGFASPRELNAQIFSIREIPMSPVDTSDGSNFSRLRQITDPENIPEQMNGLFFPIPTSTYTDGPGLLEYVATKFAEAKLEEESSDRIIYFTDGLFNCIKAGSVGAPPFDRRCRNSAEFVARSIWESGQVVTNSLMQSRITLDMFLFGNSSVGPHTIVYKDPVAGNSQAACVDDDAARQLGLSWVNASPGLDSAKGFPYSPSDGLLNAWANNQTIYFANSLYDYFVKDTGGIWVPIRPCWDEGAGCVNLVDEYRYNSDCDHFFNQGRTRFLNNSSCIPGGGGQIPSGCRLQFDPFGRSVDDQVTAGMEKILNNNPLVVVTERKPEVEEQIDS